MRKTPNKLEDMEVNFQKKKEGSFSLMPTPISE